jgi:amyloid beta precursor protein binding protein 1
MAMSREEKYDRQLRLWATQGQRQLESARVLVVQPTITSLELLKNLVLPGIGSFTLLDVTRVVGNEELSNNFYLKEDDLGADRIVALKNNLNELNEDVSSDHIHVEDFELWISNISIDFWKQYNLVVMNTEIQSAITQLYKLRIPLIVTDTYGFYGFLRLLKPTFEVVETHSQSLPDLRILTPWKELQDYSDSIDLESLDLERHSQVPYLIIQLKAVDKWKEIHGSLPKTQYEKKEFKSMILNWKKEYQELNFDEAIENSHKIFTTTKLSYNVQDLFGKVDEFFESPETRSLFWIQVKALKQFVAKNDGFLPVTGELPDMDSATENYITLKSIYLAKSKCDTSSFTQELEEVLSTITSDYIVDHEAIKIFVKNAKHLYFAQNKCRPLDAHNLKQVITGDLSQNNMILLAIFLVQRFIILHKYFPTMNDLETLLSDAVHLVTKDNIKDILAEILRSQGKELNNICSLLGGIAGQEAIKLITSQYIPLDNTLVFDGLRSVTERWKVD